MKDVLGILRPLSCCIVLTFLIGIGHSTAATSDPLTQVQTLQEPTEKPQGGGGGRVTYRPKAKKPAKS